MFEKKDSQEELSSIPVGTNVVLKNDYTVLMIVSEYKDGIYKCLWFNKNNELQKGDFPEGTIVIH